MRRRKKDKPNYVSLFCGCGGFDMGFNQAGFSCVGAFDNDPISIETHKANFHSRSELFDLSDASLPLNTYTGNSVDVVIAGPPCQGFSTAGKRCFEDPRNYLLLSAGLIAVNIKPKVIVVENVTGVTAGEHKQYWLKLQDIILSAGYHISEIVCDASKLGVPQSRKRVILLAWNNGYDIEFELPESKPMVLSDVLKKLDNIPNHVIKPLPYDSYELKISRNIKPGQKLSNVRGGPRSVHTWDIPEVFGRTTIFERIVLESILRLRRRIRVRDFGDADPVSSQTIFKYVGKPVDRAIISLLKKGYIRRIGNSYDLTNTFNGKFRRLQLDKPALTVDTRFGTPRYFLHPEEHRGFTVREAARIQGFPDSFVFYGSEKDHFRLIGNAVPPPISYRIASYILDVLINN